MIELFIIGSVLVWRLTRLIGKESGPYMILAKFRSRVGIYNTPSLKQESRTEIGRMILCPKCLSLWVGWIVALLYAIFIDPNLNPVEILGGGVILSGGTLIVEAVYHLIERHGM